MVAMLLSLSWVIGPVPMLKLYGAPYIVSDLIILAAGKCVGLVITSVGLISVTL